MSPEPHIAEIAFTEIQGGGLTSAGFDDLLGICRRVATDSSLQPTIRELGWSREDAPHEVLAELAARSGFAKIADRAADAEAFTKLTYVAASNAVLGLFRKTAAGNLAKRCSAVLRDSGEFIKSSQGWNLQSTLQGVWDQDEQRLIQAVFDVDIEPPAAWSGDRRSPLVSSDDLRTLLHEILTAAGTPVPASVIIAVVRVRLNVAPTSLTIGLNDEYDIPVPSFEDRALHAMTAEAVFGQLSDEERLILGNFDASDRALAAMLNCGKTRANKRKKLAAMAFDLLVGDEGVAEQVLELCQEWAGTNVQ